MIRVPFFLSETRINMILIIWLCISPFKTNFLSCHFNAVKWGMTISPVSPNINLLWSRKHCFFLF
ncbi:MAG TPA: hypothetical protein [Caudoviricetes sp.]|nr:MAG TPA: hypothetical protein [Caudoviricetes sp.]